MITTKPLPLYEAVEDFIAYLLSHKGVEPSDEENVIIFSIMDYVSACETLRREASFISQKIVMSHHLDVFSLSHVLDDCDKAEMRLRHSLQKIAK